MEFQERVDRIKRDITEKQQKLISINSVQNFVWSFDKLSNKHKEPVEKLLIEYFEFLEKEEFIIDRKISQKIGYDFIAKIGPYYAIDLGFRGKITLLFALMVGLHLDLIFLIIGVLGKIYYVPITTVSLLLRRSYLKFFYERKNKVYSMGY